MRLIRMASMALIAGLGLAPTASASPAASAAPVPDRAIDLFVSPEGDGRQCIERAPCSLPTLLDRITAFQRAHRDVVVTLAGGTYRLDETVELGDEHTPADGYTVTWRAVAGETPVLSGGVVLDGPPSAHGPRRA